MSPQTGWILNDEIVPRLCGAIPNSVLCVGAEDPQELVQDGITMAAKMIDRVESQGKLGKVTPSNIAYYTIQHLKSGRRANGSRSVDVLGSNTQLNGSTKLHSLNEVVSVSEAGDEIFELQDVISQDHEDPSVKACRNLDWQAFMASLNKLEQLLVECLVNGLGIREAAELAHVSYWTMREYREKIAVKLLEFMGVDILKDIAQLPHWKIGLHCERELMACRAERRN
jgi:hypothetical protein